MAHHFNEGISLFTNTNAAVYSDVADGKKFKSLVEVNPTITTTPWATWGDDNQEPIRMADDIENCGILSAGITSKVRMAIGQGISPKFKIGTNADGSELLENCTVKEVVDWFERNNTYKYSYSNIYNLLGYGWGATQIMLNAGRNYINRIKAADVYTARLSQETSGVITDMYLCSNWEAVSTYDPTKMQKISVLEEDYELEHLQSKTSGFEFVMLHRLLTNGRRYYPKAMWQAARAYVRLSRSIPKMKEAINKNQMAIKYLILIDAKYWEKNYPGFTKKTDDERKVIVKAKHTEINNWLTGEQNAGKTIIAGKYWEEYTKQFVEEISIQVLDDKWKDGKMLPDGAAFDKQILFSMFFNPAIWGGNLLGDGASGGAGSGSDIREAFLVQIMLMHAERVMNAQVFTLVKQFNGWAKYESEGKQLVFRYDTSILTTLDTGKSTKAATN